MHDQGWALVTCQYCGKRFMDDCGDSFCSADCDTKFWEETRRQEDEFDEEEETE